MLNALNWQKNNPDKTSLWSDAQQAEVPRSVSGWLKALKPFQSRPDLIRVSASGKGKGAAVVAKSANRKGVKATQAKSKASAKSAQSKTAKSAKSAKSTSAAKSKSNNAKKPQ
jgi:hypothetical protein